MAAPLLQSGPHAPSMAFGMRVQTLLTSHVLPLTCLINSVVFFIEKQKKGTKKKGKKDIRTLCVALFRRPDQMTVRVLCICSTAQCKRVNTFFFKPGFCLV